LHPESFACGLFFYYVGPVMKDQITIRYQQIGDAGRFVEILNNPNFLYFPAKPKTVKEEKEFLRQNAAWRKNGEQFNYTILLNGRVAGATGIHIDPRRSYCGEIGYFVDEARWGRGIACEAVRLLEEIAFNDLGVVRIEINMLKMNRASERVAIKCGYRKEGIGRKKLMLNGEYLDCYVYSKVRE
jgi:ribosomal-protein-alanine N-acetyltransferase